MFSCSRIQKQLGAYLDGELSPKRRTAVERHLVRCLLCRIALENLRRLERALENIKVPPAPSDLAWRIMAKARAHQSGESEQNVIRLGRRLPTSGVWSFRIAAAAVLVFGLGVGSYLGWSGGRSMSGAVTARTAVPADPLGAYNLDYLSDAPEGSLAGSYLALASNPKGY